MYIHINLYKNFTYHSAMMSIKVLKSIFCNKISFFFRMESLLLFSKPSSILTMNIMSFNGDYVNLGCHKVMSLKIYIHHKMSLFSK